MSEAKMVDGRLMPLSPAELAQREIDQRTASRPLPMPLGLVLERALEARKLSALAAQIDRDDGLRAKLLAQRGGLDAADPAMGSVLAAAST